MTARDTPPPCHLRFGLDGAVDQTHDWRLIEEVPQAREPVYSEWVRGVPTAIEVVPARTRWFCTRCRVIDELLVPPTTGDTP